MAKILEIDMGAGTITNGYPNVRVRLLQIERLQKNNRMLKEIPISFNLPKEIKDGSNEPKDTFNADLEALVSKYQSYYRSFYGDTQILSLENNEITDDNDYDYEEVEEPKITNFSVTTINQLYEELEEKAKKWFIKGFHNSNPEKERDKKDIDQELKNHLIPDEPLIINIKVNNLEDEAQQRLLLLPWESWDFVKGHKHRFVVFFRPGSNQTQEQKREKIKILVILGKTKEIDISEYINMFQKNQETYSSYIDKIEFFYANNEIIEENFAEQLTQKIAEPEGWDIIFFAGHSNTQNGEGLFEYSDNKPPLRIKNFDKIIEQAIELGLRMIFFNSCRGIGLANDLSKLNISFSIVMRELVHNQVAYQFAQKIIESFLINQKPLPLAMQEARSELDSDELKKSFIAPHWNPVLFHNPMETYWSLAEWVKLPCPYQGLKPFQEEDAESFFGRKALTDRLLDLVNNNSLLFVIGSSGSGKSSAVFAGLIPSWKKEQTQQLPRKVAHFRPCHPFDNPFYNLAQALIPLLYPQPNEVEKLEVDRDLGWNDEEFFKTIDKIVQQDGGSQLLLFVDQFEEIRTLPDDKLRQSFLKRLFQAVNKPGFKLVLTLRTEFIEDIAKKDTSFANAWENYHHEEISSSEYLDLQEVITLPAKEKGIELESGLTKKIIQDCKKTKTPTPLPVIQVIMAELWEKQKRGFLSEEDYLGGLEKALYQYAEKAFIELTLTPDEQNRARQIFLRLVYLGESEEQNSRRKATHQEIGEENWDLVTKFATKNLLVTDEYKESINKKTTSIKTVEIIHDVLIQNWVTLKEWIKNDHEFLWWRQGFRDNLEKWKNNNNKNGYLLRKGLLIDAKKWLKERPNDLREDEKEYINKSSTQQIFEIVTGILLLTGGLIAIAIFGAEANRQRIEANKQQQDAQMTASTVLVENLLNSDKPLESLIEAIRVGKQIQKTQVEVQPNTQNRVLLSLLKTVYNTREINRLVVDKESLNSINSIAFSPDGRIIASHNSSTIRLWNLAGTLLREIPLKIPNQVVVGHGKISFSHDGKLIALGVSIDKLDPNNPTKFPNPNEAKYGVRIWTLEGKLLKTFEGHKNFVSSQFSPDGLTIATASYDKTVKLWNLNGQLLKTINVGEGELSFNSDGKILAVYGDENINLLNSDGRILKTLKGHEFRVKDVAFSPDNQILASVDNNGNVKFWDLKSGSNLKSLKGNTASAYGSVVFSPDGKLIASTDGFEIKIWNRDGQLIDTLTGHTALVTQLSFSPDGQLIASSSAEGTIKLWNGIDTKFTTIPSKAKEVAFSPNSQILSLAEDKQVKLFYRNDLLEKTIEGFNFPLTDVKFDSTGKMLVSLSIDGNVKLWNLEGKLIRSIDAKTKYIVPQGHIPAQDVVFIPNSNKLISAGIGSLLTWTLDGNYGKVLAVINDPGINQPFLPWSIDVSSDTKHLAVANMGKVNGKLLIYTAGERQFKILLEDINNDIPKVKFSPNGNIIAVASVKKGIIRLLAINGKEISVMKHNGGVFDVVFTPDGQRILTAGQDGIRLWDIQGKLISHFGGTADEFIGVGIKFEIDKKKGVLVTTVHENSPALKSGIQVGDQILAVNGQSIANKTQEDITKLLKGKEGEQVIIKLSHSNGEIVDIKINRGKVIVPFPYIIEPLPALK